MEVAFAKKSLTCYFLKNLLKMHILDQSIPYLNLYILSLLTLFAELFETKSETRSCQNAHAA